MKVAFYYRQGSRSFGCLLPDEKEKLRTFLNTEQKYKPEKELKSNHQFPLALYLSYTCLFTLPQPLQYHCSALPGILYDLSGSHLDMAQGIIFPNLPDVLQIKILADYRFRHHPHHLLPAA